MMNPELKQRWVEALRSGKYDQGIEYLSKDDKFCCLGVLCDITKDEFNLKVTYDPIHGADRFNGYYDYPDSAMNLMFFGNEDIPSVNIDGDLNSLAVHNDAGIGFKAIAKAIEEQL